MIVLIFSAALCYRIDCREAKSIIGVTTMDMVVINCPFCGGEMQRRNNDYHAYCTYCGREVCFDEIKEEAQLASYREKLVELQYSNSALINHRQQEENLRQQLRSWIKKRNICFAVITLLNALGFSIICAVDEKSDLMGLGVTSVLAAWTTLLTSSIIFSSTYPSYNYLTGRNEPVNRLGLFFKLFGAGLGLCALGTFGGIILLLALGVVE